MTSTIELIQVSKSFGKKNVLKAINIKVDAGQIFGLIGPSGSGKTTLVKIIVGMDQPSTGQVQVLNTQVPNLKLLQSIGYMAQADALYNDLTGQENLAFFASLYKLSKEVKKERIAYAANLVELTPHLSKKVLNYSGGMKRRLSLAIALIHDPQILILDEPTVGIDPELRKSIWAEIVRLKSEGKTILITTHVMDEAEKCDQLAMVRDGEIISNGSPATLKSHYNINSLEEVFLKAGGEKDENNRIS
ncbi:ABC transporter ATP-binding protein [Psychrobacillus lasiicapitis]|uniref:ABC transporter ATP-binding protein n=1 Tax=Psychrobacillus lasiicapitis TaxID=1636719 RepID=A0A544SU09_9BACI|nr:ABC transporter ATP-binding protein [Psychrobacillus lasiicapitis]TQR08638.1 ABC transporter ATP-binding protein [Psychrobacillus lasiicapitis]GGA45165.1 ABC transporter ATP-binding protein [Psychrobacillus lasiicapitis]